MTTLLTIEEAAPLVRKTEAAMRWWIKRENCPLTVAKIGGRLLLSREEIEAYIETQFQVAS